MGLFGKKEESPQEEIQIDEATTRKAPVATRRLRRKKDPIQPWGKKERFFIFYVLLFTIFASSVLAMSAREWKLPGLPAFEIKLPSFSKKVINIEGDNKKLSQKDTLLISDFKKITNSLSGKYGFYVKDLNTGKEIGLYKDDIFQAASLIKVPVMMALYQDKPDGYQDLVNRMGKRSDNNAFREAVRILGDKKINETIKQVGMVNTSLEENETSMRDMAVIFKDLYEANTLTVEESQEILDSMEDTIYEDHLVAGIPDNVVVSHKYGREVHVVNDGGIVYLNNPYIVFIMTKGVVESEADEIFPLLSELIYKYAI